jgi:hypothetical protein
MAVQSDITDQTTGGDSLRMLTRGLLLEPENQETDDRKGVESGHATRPTPCALN